MKKQMIAIVTLAMLSIPSALAGWNMMGSYEPDTKLDKEGGWMWLGPDVNPDQSVRKVYFNGFYAQCVNGSCTGLNPNVASIRTGVHNAEYEEKALLGVWKDCNQDGFLGLGDQGLFEYRSELLGLFPSVCPAQPVPQTDIHGDLPHDWVPVHNDGTWVHEFLPIQWRDTVLPAKYDANPFNFNDQGARVWMDHGLEPSYQIGCYYTSFPVGTFRSTGGLLHTLDCADSYRATDTFDTVADSNATTKNLSFSDAPRDQAASQSILNKANPWGKESDASDAQVWDCNTTSPLHAIPNTPPGTPVSNTVGESSASPKGPSYHILRIDSSTDYNVSMPKVPPSVSTGGSAAGTMNATGSGFDHCARNQQSDAHNHEGDSLAGLPYDESATTESHVRTAPDDTMSPIEHNRPNAPQAAVPGYGKWGPGDVGLHWVPGDCHDTGWCSQDGVWTGDRVWHQETVFTGKGGIAPVTYETYYAYVSPAAISEYNLLLPKGTTTGTYGQEACGAFGFSGVHNNWDCDKTHWYQDVLGADQRPRSHYLGPDPNPPPNTICAEYSQQANIDAGCLTYASLPGDPYNMKDIDCYDQSFQQLRPLGVSYGTLTGTRCDVAP